MLKMPPYCRYSVAMGMLSFPFLFARKFSHAFQHAYSFCRCVTKNRLCAPVSLSLKRVARLEKLGNTSENNNGLSI